MINAALRRFSGRQIRTRPGRALLTLISIFIGVGAIVAVEMLAVSIRGASQEMFSTVVGSAALIIEPPGDAPIDRSLVETVGSVEGVQAAVPVIQRAVTLFTGEGEERAKTRGMVLGVDPQRDKALRDHEIVEGRFFTDTAASGDTEAEIADEDEPQRDEIVLEENFARARKVQLGDEVRLLGGGLVPKKLKVVGLVRSTSYARATAGGLAYIPLTAAQRFFFRERDVVTAIQILTEKGANEAEVAERINAKLREASDEDQRGLTAEAPSGRTAVLEQTLQPTEQGLDVAVVFVALLAAFIVFNTFMMNVSERRRQMAIIRAIGGTRGQLFSTLILESLMMGILGTAVGLFLGWRGTVRATQLLGSTLEVDLPPAELTWLIALKGAAFGIGIAMVGALFPAWRAAQLTPLEAMSPLAKTDVDRTHVGPVSIGIGFLAVGGLMLYATMQRYLPITWGVYPALLMLVGMVVLAETLLVRPVSTFVAAAIHPIFGATSTLAKRQIIRHQTRSALTSGVLFIAAATGVGLSYVILDTVANVRAWYNRTIIGDFYIRVALPDFATGESPETPVEFDDRLNELVASSGLVQSMDRARIVKSKIQGVDTMIGAREYPTPAHASFDLIEGGTPEEVYAKLTQPDPSTGSPHVIVSSVVAAKAGIHAGDVVELDTPSGPQKVKVAAINNEYLVGGLMVWMHRNSAERLLGITGYDGYILLAEPGKQDELRTQLEPLTREYGLLLQSFNEIHTTIDRIIRSSDLMLWTLVFVEFIVASFGMVNTLTMSVLEQTRELGMLRIIAMTRKQVRRTIIAQAIIIGLMGIVPGILVGLLIAYLMNVATYASIAHPVEFGFHPWLVLGTFFGSMALIMVAALLPAFRASQIDVLKALQYE